MSSQFRCTHCQWNFDQVFCGGYSKEYPGPLDYQHYIEKQLEYCNSKPLHISCANRLREKNISLRQKNPEIETLINAFTVVDGQEDVFSLRPNEDVEESEDDLEDEGESEGEESEEEAVEDETEDDYTDNDEDYEPEEDGSQVNLTSKLPLKKDHLEISTAQFLRKR